MKKEDKEKIKRIIEEAELCQNGLHKISGGFVSATIKEIVEEKSYIEVTADIKLGEQDKEELYKDVYYWLDKKDYHILSQKEYEKCKNQLTIENI